MHYNQLNIYLEIYKHLSKKHIMNLLNQMLKVLHYLIIKKKKLIKYYQDYNNNMKDKQQN